MVCKIVKIEVPMFILKQAAKLAYEAALQLALDNLVTTINLACSTAQGAASGCLECCDCSGICCNEGQECCDGACQAEPCCEPDDPCCGRASNQ